ncbi:MAG: zinc-ribbon domain-containing protein [Acholeplasmatales bacterium]|nr:zinc-ribbon domain-containing protein [Acholeplasmatales bacterium]
MKFCINCGSKLNDDDLFCMECGYKCNDVKEKDETIEKEEKSLPNEDIIVAPPIVSNSKEDRLKALEEERKRLEEEIEKEKEEARLKELERQRQEELERQRQEELERQRQEELERQRQEELERQRQEELELQRQEELERQRQEEKVQEPKTPEEVQEAKTEEETKAVVPLIDENKKEEIKEEKEIKNNESVITNEENIVLIKHSLFFTGLILILSIIYWFIGAFFYIHVAIRIVMIFICMLAMALPIYETVKYLISSIKAKKFNLFTLVTLGICQVLLFILFFISISVAAS